LLKELGGKDMLKVAMVMILAALLVDGVLRLVFMRDFK
jgi:hypothetical protein